MELSNDQQQAYNVQIRKMKEDGFFLPAKRSLSGDTRYLIISYGGTGAAALFAVKKQFETILPAKEIETQVRFLAIDTDSATKKLRKDFIQEDGTRKTVELDSLNDKQFVHLPGNAAKNEIHPDGTMAPAIEAWINPVVVQRILKDPTVLNGEGASGTRQIGRLTLYPTTTRAQIYSKIVTAVGELTNGTAAHLKIFILTGIAGGTGSGTVVDLTYLIRHYIEQMPGNLKDRTQYAGYVLLPPTGDSNNPDYIARGNRNGYAALKEINHFLNLRGRGGNYQVCYTDGTVVSSGENIFDVCYLLDGVSDGVAFDNAREQALKVLSEAILDMVCASQVSAEGKQVQAVDSFMNDWTTTRNGMIAGKSTSLAMRDADYLYCVLGHNEFAIPSHEVKAYVAKQMFDKIYGLFRNAFNVEPDDVENMLKNILKAGKTKSVILGAVYSESNKAFTMLAPGKGGPFYTINLLRDLMVEVDRQKQRLRLVRIGGATDEMLDWITGYASYLNSTVFNAYVAAMEALKDMMGEQFNTVVQGSNNGMVYTFIPENMGNLANADAVIGYLDGLINGARLRTLTGELLQEMIDNRDEWVALVSAEDPTVAPKAMRRFWNVKLDSIVNATLEDLMIKIFSGDPNAHYDPNNHEATHGYLETAAQTIYQMLLGAGGTAKPMADFVTAGLNASSFNPHTYVMVPECAPHLYDALCGLAQPTETVCLSRATDRISCYNQYTSVPAFKLKWVWTAEKQYEQDIKTEAGAGSHISETIGGNQWQLFPNLLPQTTWAQAPLPPYEAPREADIARRAEKLFDQAESHKLLSSMMTAAGIKTVEYTAKLLPTEYRPEEKLFRDLGRAVAGSEEEKKVLAGIDAAAEACAKKLFDEVKEWSDNRSVREILENSRGEAFFQKKKLYFTGCYVMTVGPGDPRPADWDVTMAKQMLRKMPDVMDELNATILVMDKLKAMVDKKRKDQNLVTKFAQFMIADLFHYSEDELSWKYRDENGLPADLVFIQNDMEKAGEYYFMFDAYRKNADAMDLALRPQLEAVAPKNKDVPVERAQKAKAFQQKAGDLKLVVRTWIEELPVKPFEALMTKKGYKVNAIKNFHKALYLELTEISQMGYVSQFEEEKDPLVEIVVDDDDSGF